MRTQALSKLDFCIGFQIGLAEFADTGELDALRMLRVEAQELAHGRPVDGGMSILQMRGKLSPG